MLDYQKEIIDLIIEDYQLDIVDETEHFLYWIKKEQKYQGFSPNPEYTKENIQEFGKYISETIYQNIDIDFDSLCQELIEKKPERP